MCSAASALAFASVEATLLSRASPLTLTASFVACRLLGGASAAAAETGAFTALCMSDWGERMGFVFAAIEVDVGLAVSVGAAVGGWLYRAGAATPVGAFALPLVCTAAAQLLLLGIVAVSIPGRAAPPTAAAAARGDARARVWSAARLGTLASVVAWTACGEGLLPVLGPHLATVAGLDASQVLAPNRGPTLTTDPSPSPVTLGLRLPPSPQVGLGGPHPPPLASGGPRWASPSPPRLRRA